MAKKSKPPSITVLQCINPNCPGIDSHIHRWVYAVKSARNVTTVAIGDRLEKAQIDELIRDGVDVSISGGM